MPMLVKGEYDDPNIPVVLEIPVSDNKLQIAARVYARQTSLLCYTKRKSQGISAGQMHEK